jgi:hypothetical protein
MPLIERPSSPADRQRIIDLLKGSLGLSDDSVVLNPEFLQWKYWATHPLFGGNRSQVIEKEGKLLAHGGIWPIQLVTSLGKPMCFHLIDWTARRDAPGAGMQVLRRCGAGLAANFSIGGSAMSQRILPAVGFRSYNPMWFLAGPLPLRPTGGWLVRGLANMAGWQSREIDPNLPAGWDVAIREPKEIPECLWPRNSPGLAVSMRSPQLLEHVSQCPVTGESLCCVLYRRSKPMAYLFLIQVWEQLRLVDYGPAGLDKETSRLLGQAVQKLAKSMFPSATEFMAATSEKSVLAGLLRAGFCLDRQESIKVLKTDTGLERIDRFRLTLLDWDLLCR